MINFLALVAATLFAPPAPFSHLLSSPPRRTAHKIALIADSEPRRQATSTSSPPSEPKPHTHTIPAPAILAISQSPIASRHRALLPPDSEVIHGSDAQAATAASMEAYCHGGPSIDAREAAVRMPHPPAPFLLTPSRRHPTAESRADSGLWPLGPRPNSWND
jgi:hypothetical protein